MTVVDYEQAARLGAATLHEAGGRIGTLPAVLTPVAAGMHVAGPAFTVQSAPGDNLWIHRGIYAASAGDVLVVATGEARAEWGYWGEIMSEAGRARGLAGVVLQGGSRDTDALATIGFPVFSLGRCIRGTTKDASSPYGRLGEPIIVGSVAVSKGDLVVGDHDGVVIVPAAAAPEVLRAGAARVEKERQVIEQLRDGASTLDLYDLGA